MPSVMIEKMITATGSRTLPFGPPVATGDGGAAVVSVIAELLPSRRMPDSGEGSRDRSRRARTPAGEGSGVDLAAALEGSPEGHLVGVLEVAAHREPAGDPGGAQAQRLEQPG